MFLRHRAATLEKLLTASHIHFLSVSQFLSCVQPLCLWSMIALVVCPLKAGREEFSDAPPRCLPKHKVLVCTTDKIFHLLPPGQEHFSYISTLTMLSCINYYILHKTSDALEATASLFAGRDPGQSSPMSDRKKNRRKKSMNQKGDAAVGQAEGNATLFTRNCCLYDLQLLL